MLRAGKPWRSVLALFVHQSRTILRPRELIVEPEHLLSQERRLLHHLATEAGSGGGASLKRFTVAAWGVKVWNDIGPKKSYASFKKFGRRVFAVAALNSHALIGRDTYIYHFSG